MKIEVKCPHCGHKFKIRNEDFKTPGVPVYGLALCPVEAGGCDNRFSYKARLKTEVRTDKVEFSD